MAGTLLSVGLVGACGRSHSTTVPRPVPPLAVASVGDTSSDSAGTATLMFVEITGTRPQFLAAGLPGMDDVSLTDDSEMPLGGGRWRVAVYVYSTAAVDKIRGAGLSVRVLKTADQVRHENESIDRSFTRDGGLAGHPRERSPL